jgi:hypothetical protein
VIERLRILEPRGRAVVLDRDLAAIYGVETKQFNRAVKRNAARFRAGFAFFQVGSEEAANLRLQIGASSSRGGRRYLPWVLTGHGAIMAAAVLNSSRPREIGLEFAFRKD